MEVRCCSSHLTASHLSSALAPQVDKLISKIDVRNAEATVASDKELIQEKVGRAMHAAQSGTGYGTTAHRLHAQELLAYNLNIGYSCLHTTT